MRPYRVMGGVLLLAVGTSAVLVLAADRPAPDSVDIVVAAGPAAAPTGSPSSRPSPSPPPLTEDQLFQMSERKRWGLEHSPDYIRSLGGQELPPSFFSVPLTAAEIAEFERRNRLLLDELGPVRTLLKKRSLETFAGVWLDHEAGGVAVVATTDAASVPLAEVQAMLSPDSVVRVETKQNSEVALIAQSKKLDEDRDELDALNIDVAMSWLDLMENTVRVDLAKESPQSDVERLLARYRNPPTLTVRVAEFEIRGM